MPEVSADAEILFERSGPLAIVTLDRPRALNALNLTMIRAFVPKLADWAADPEVRTVVIRGAGDKAFCAGGDVRAVWEAGRTAKAAGKVPDSGMTADFFREEYILNHAIHVFPKPFVALVDGISMGGGVGLSVHGSHRVVTERTVVAMPETAIGLFPDVGGGWFLPRCPGETGTYLALTGARIRAADCVHIGYATHHVPAERLAAATEALAGADLSGGGAAVSRVLDRFATDPGEAPLAGMRGAIDRCFGHDTVEEILAALDREATDWAEGVAKTLRGRSPTSLKVTLRQLRLGREMDYEDVVAMEYRLSQACMAGHDFYEGIRAVLVDKDHSPRWEPAALSGVLEADVERHFQPLGARDLILGQASVDGSEAPRRGG